jgi:hypothetical protein
MVVSCVVRALVYFYVDARYLCSFVGVVCVAIYALFNYNKTLFTDLAFRNSYAPRTRPHRHRHGRTETEVPIYRTAANASPQPARPRGGPRRTIMFSFVYLFIGQ